MIYLVSRAQLKPYARWNPTLALSLSVSSNCFAIPPFLVVPPPPRGSICMLYADRVTCLPEHIWIPAECSHKSDKLLQYPPSLSLSLWVSLGTKNFITNMAWRMAKLATGNWQNWQFKRALKSKVTWDRVCLWKMLCIELSWSWSWSWAELRVQRMGQSVSWIG